MSETNEIASLDRLIHEPARLAILSVLYAVKEADFLFLLRETGLTKGNLSTHLSKLEAAGYIEIEKGYVGKLPQTLCRMTGQGRQAFDDYRKQLKDFLNNF
jgi:DNA-binding transcriptional ArsR family regulator